MRFENSDCIRLRWLEVLSKLAFQIGLLWIMLLSTHAWLVLLLIHILELADGVMPLMIALPCTLHSMFFSRLVGLQHLGQVPLLRCKPLIMDFTSILHSIRCSLLPTLTHNPRSLLQILLLNLQ
jgi:hypothetical protein